MKIQYFEKTHVGLTREENQDSIKVIPELGAYLVADGMGGEKAGAEASAQVVTSVTRVVSDFFEGGRALNPEAVGQMAVRALEEANNDVNGISEKDASKAGMGSTATFLCLYRGLYFISQVGDSRAYLVRNGNVRQLTRDHSIVWELYEGGIIKREQLETHPERHLLTQCIGSSRPIEVDLYSDRVKPGDLFLLCSDGLHGYAGEREMMPRLTDPIYTLEERTFRLLQAALSGGGGDNVSILLVKVEELESTDNWEPQRGVPAFREIGQGMHSTMSLITPLTGTIKTILPKRKGAGKLVAFAALFMMVAAAVLFGAAFLKIKGFCATLDVKNVAPAALDQIEIRATGANSKPMPKPRVTRIGDRFEVCFKRREPMLVSIDAPGVLPYSIEVDPENLSDAPIVVSPKLAGVLKLDLPAGAEIKSVKIVNETIGEPVFEQTKGGRASLPASFDLEPDQPHMITVIDAADTVFSLRKQIGAGHEESVQVKF